MSYEDVVSRLQHLGMSGYEAKTYLALIAAGTPLNGYEVAKRSGVPRSTVYETLAKLVARGAAFEVRGSSDAVEYLPLPVRSLLERLGRDYTASLDALGEMLPAIAAPPTAHLIHDLRGRESLLERARDVVAGARRELFLSVWPQEMAVLAEEVQRAEQRGVEISVVAFGEMTEVGHTYQHVLSAPDVVLENLGCRLFTLVGDRQEAVIGGFTETGAGGPGAWGVYTDNPAVVLLSVEYVRHDIAIQLFARGFDTEQIHRFWDSDPDMARLRADQGLPAARLRAADEISRTRVPARGRGRRSSA